MAVVFYGSGLLLWQALHRLSTSMTYANHPNMAHGFKLEVLVDMVTVANLDCDRFEKQVDDLKAQGAS